MRYRSLDAWRGLACLFVIAFHVTGPASGGLVARGWIGVPLFFVISGYCIAASAESTLQRGRPLRDYFRRRVRRIFPPYVAALILTILLALLLPSVFVGPEIRGVAPLPDPRTLTALDWIGSVTLTSGWLPHLMGDPPGRGWWLAHAWTLGYEEQFYAVTGALLLLGRRWWWGALVLTVPVVVLVLTGTRWYFAGLFLDGQWLLFALGVGVYAGLHRGNRLVWAAPLIAIAWGVTHLGSRTATGLIVAGAFACLLWVLHPYDAWLNARAGVLRWAGTRCYSLYLVHYPVCGALLLVTAHWSRPALVWIAVPGAMILSALVALPFHRRIEQPWMNAYAPAEGRELQTNPPPLTALALPSHDSSGSC